MNGMREPWDYLIVTASNDAQAKAYQGQLALRRKLGLLADFREVLVVPDAGGKRIGSGGSTIHCLTQVLNGEVKRSGDNPADWSAAKRILQRRRILIIHAGGDSRRLPAYAPCGKIFVPVPGESDSGLWPTLFDRLLPTFVPFPAAPEGRGQVVVIAGDALVQFDPSLVRLTQAGLTALGCRAPPEQSSKHGVFCADGGGKVRLFLQKPSPSEQARGGAIDREGKSILDVGVMSFDATVAVTLLKAFQVAFNGAGRLAWSRSMNRTIQARGLDIYREICCAMGSEATAGHHLASARSSGSTWDVAALRAIHRALKGVPFHVQVLPQCGFLHFGTTRQLIGSGLELLRQADSGARNDVPLSINNRLRAGGSVRGPDSWVEGCRVGAPLVLAGRNVVIGVDVDEALCLPPGACLDVIAGRNRKGRRVWFVRCYDVADTFKDSVQAGATFCGRPMLDWISAVGATAEDVWDADAPAGARSLWNARVFPAVKDHREYRNWLWMFDQAPRTAERKQAFRSADRYSVAEMATLADPDSFYSRRDENRTEQVRHSLRRAYGLDSAFSSEDLAHVLASAPDRSALAAELLGEAKFHLDAGRAGTGLETFVFCRVIHSLGSALPHVGRRRDALLRDVLPGLAEALPPPTAAWLGSLGLTPRPGLRCDEWAERARNAAFRQMNEAILRSSMSKVGHPRNALRPDETVWGRAPARLELGGGWTDTPPYTLEYGGSVANTAVNLNGQPPIHCYCRVTEEPVIRLNSIDAGRHLLVTELEELLDYRRPGDSFALLKAALAISGFSPEMADWPNRTTLRDMLRQFGGGIELTTLVGIPKGSGLGTSSIIGAVLVAVINRLMGRPQDQREIFHNVLRLEQALTTGGGWQDQIGGGVGGTKITITRPGMFPGPDIHYVPDDLLDPALNGNSTLLYYTGLTRLAKNILQQIVGGYFNRDRTIMSALAQEHHVARRVAEAMGRKDPAEFGRCIDEAWRLQKRLCGEVTNEAIESLLDRVRPHIHGARISGAGSGGFLMMICKSPGDAQEVRRDLEARPLNDRARFFDYQINHAGLEVATC